MIKLKRICWLHVAIFLTACTSALPTLPSAPAETIIQHTPVLRNLETSIQACSLQNSPLPVLVNEYPIDRMNVRSADISLMYGDPLDTSLPAFQIGEDELVMIVNPQNKISSLSLVDLQGILQNFITRWNVIDPNTGNEIAGDIEVLIYPKNNELQKIIETQLNGNQRIGNRTTSVDQPEELRDMVSRDPAALGFIPKRLLTDSVKVVGINDIPREDLAIHIIAQTRGQPGILQTTMINCLQDLSGQ